MSTVATIDTSTFWRDGELYLRKYGRRYDTIYRVTSVTYTPDGAYRLYGFRVILSAHGDLVPSAPTRGGTVTKPLGDSVEELGHLFVLWPLDSDAEEWMLDDDDIREWVAAGKVVR